jgi:hypothetical protein
MLLGQPSRILRCVSEDPLRITSVLKQTTVATLAIVTLAGTAANAAELPAYLRGIVGTSTSSAGEVATKNILQLNTSMFDLYADAGLTFRKNILAQHPVILALFSGAGGRFILYRPSMVPLDAPPVCSSSTAAAAVWRTPAARRSRCPLPGIRP